jgi:hypothetical protein
MSIVLIIFYLLAQTVVFMFTDRQVALTTRSLEDGLHDRDVRRARAEVNAFAESFSVYI